MINRTVTLFIINSLLAALLSMTSPALSAPDEFIEKQPLYSNDFAEHMKSLSQKFPDGNVMEWLFLVFRESIEGTSEDKKFFIEKLIKYNSMGEAFSEYLQIINDRANELENIKQEEPGSDSKQEVQDVPNEKIDLTTTTKATQFEFPKDMELGVTTPAMVKKLLDRYKKGDPKVQLIDLLKATQRMLQFAILLKRPDLMAELLKRLKLMEAASKSPFRLIPKRPHQSPNPAFSPDHNPVSNTFGGGSSKPNPDPDL